MADQAYASYQYRLPELEHHYGPNVHLLADPVLLTQLARLSRPETVQPEITYLVRDLYEHMVQLVVAHELPRRSQTVRTRMFNATPNGIWVGSLIDPDTRVVTVDIARAGTLPSQVAFEALTRMLDPSRIRQDHIYMNRVTDGTGQVVGVNVAGSKIGGDIAGAFVLFPDPMGATGGSLSHALSIYKERVGARSARFVSMHLIVTPEHLRAVLTAHPDTIIYAIRCDRGLSDPEVWRTPLGQRWDEEKGLNERQYIVPGAGGLGEVLNNSYV